MNQLFSNAIRKASEIRIKLDLDLFEPINIFDVCSSLEIDVQFVDINMEGFYINNNGTPRILLSCLRPFARRVFTCGHELGHHVFGHGLKVDLISDDKKRYSLKNRDEILVDAFSAALLMPIGGIQAEFSKRNLKFNLAKPIDFYMISSIFGVGYQTLITQCRVNRLINNTKSVELLKFTPAEIFKKEFIDLREISHFKIIDGKSDIKTIDLEVSNYILLPTYIKVEDKFLKKIHENEMGSLYLAMKPGISCCYFNKNNISSHIRIQPQKYIGFVNYRHLKY